MPDETPRITGEPGAYRIVQDGLLVEWARLGEGIHGDYDPEDPEDVELLRFDVSREVDGRWEPCREGSYCTGVPADSPPEVQKAALACVWWFIGDGAGREGRVSNGDEASWIDPGWQAVVTSVAGRLDPDRVRDVFIWYRDRIPPAAVDLLEKFSDRQRRQLVREDLVPLLDAASSDVRARTIAALGGTLGEGRPARESPTRT